MYMYAIILYHNLIARCLSILKNIQHYKSHTTIADSLVEQSSAKVPLAT